MNPLTAVPAIPGLSIPSPSWNAIPIGPLSIHMYAICIVAGIVVCVILAERRYVARGGQYGVMQDLALWAVPFGIVGGRIYHVITDPGAYFESGENHWDAFAIWHGGLGIWGAIPLGMLGIWLGARQKGIRLVPLFDALAPCVLIAQGIGRWGNYFNQELFGRPTKLPWGLEISPAHQLDTAGHIFPVGTTFHPTFLYECVWDIGMALLIFWLDRRFRLGHGRVVALYVALYCLGRGWIESLRIDGGAGGHLFGLRWNDWMSVVLGLVATAYFVWASYRRPGREESVYRAGHEPEPADPIRSGESV